MGTHLQTKPWAGVHGRPTSRFKDHPGLGTHPQTKAGVWGGPASRFKGQADLGTHPQTKPGAGVRRPGSMVPQVRGHTFGQRLGSGEGQHPVSKVIQVWGYSLDKAGSGEGRHPGSKVTQEWGWGRLAPKFGIFVKPRPTLEP